MTSILPPGTLAASSSLFRCMKSNEPMTAIATVNLPSLVADLRRSVVANFQLAGDAGTQTHRDNRSLMARQEIDARRVIGPKRVITPETGDEAIVPQEERRFRTMHIRALQPDRNSRRLIGFERFAEPVVEQGNA